MFCGKFKLIFFWFFPDDCWWWKTEIWRTGEMGTSIMCKSCTWITVLLLSKHCRYTVLWNIWIHESRKIMNFKLRSGKCGRCVSSCLGRGTKKKKWFAHEESSLQIYGVHCSLTYNSLWLRVEHCGTKGKSLGCDFSWRLKDFLCSLPITRRITCFFTFECILNYRINFGCRIKVIACATMVNSG